MSRAVPAAERFERDLERLPWSGCWVWTRCVNSTGYGSIGVDGKMVNVHRFSWRLHFGEIPKGQYVLHKCDVRACVNPQHLFLGSQLQNIRDGQGKGRIYKLGEDACKNKHPALPKNVYFTKGHRFCLLCKRDSRKRVKARRLEEHE